MPKPRVSQRYCNMSCRNRAHAAKCKVAKQPRLRRLRCHWCSGGHISTACPNRNGATVKQFGTMGPNREYIPPPGVEVRVRHLGPLVFGEDMPKERRAR